MPQIEKIIKGIFFPGISSRRHRLWALVGVGATQIGLITLLFSVASPLYAFVVAAAIPCVVAILLSPHLGVYILAACIIGQWPWNIMRYVLMLVTASTLVWLLLHRKPLFLWNPILILTGLFTAFVLISTISPRTHTELWSAALAFVGHFTLVWILVTLIDSRQAVRWIVQLMVISGVITAVIGLIQARTHFIWPASTTYYEIHYGFFREKSGMELQGWMDQFRIDSITGTPDYLPLYLQTLMPFVGFWLARQQNRVRQMLGLLVLLLFGVVHLLSFTRGAILTTAIVLVLIGWMVDKRRLIAFGPTLVLIGFVAVMSWKPMRERVISMVSLKPLSEEEANMESLRWRLLTLPVGVKMLFERPLLGMGVGQQHYNWSPSARSLIPDLEKPVPIHNSYLQAGIDTGLGGLVMLLALMVTTIRRLQWLIKRFHAMGDLELADTARASLVAFIGLAFAMMVYPMLGVFRYFWLLVGLVGSLVRIEGMLQQTSSHVVSRGVLTLIFAPVVFRD